MPNEMNVTYWLFQAKQLHYVFGQLLHDSQKWSAQLTPGNLVWSATLYPQLDTAHEQLSAPSSFWAPGKRTMHNSKYIIGFITEKINCDLTQGGSPQLQNLECLPLFSWSHPLCSNKASPYISRHFILLPTPSFPGLPWFCLLLAFTIHRSRTLVKNGDSWVGTVKFASPTTTP